MRNEGKLKPEFNKLENMNRDTAAKYFQMNPQIETDMARYIAGHVLHRQKGDKAKAAYSWITGHNLFPHQITNDHIKNSDYVQKFMQAEKVNPLKAKFKMPTRTLVAKAEPIDFSIRLDIWKKKRQKQANELMPNSTNWTPDPGRLREKELDEKKAPSEMTATERLKQNLKDANKK